MNRRYKQKDVKRYYSNITLLGVGGFASGWVRVGHSGIIVSF